MWSSFCRFFIFVMALAAGTSSTARAQNNPTQANEPLCFFVQNDAELKSARSRIKASQQQYKQALSYAWPSVELQSSWRQSKTSPLPSPKAAARPPTKSLSTARHPLAAGQSAGPLQAGLQLTQTLLSGGRLTHAMQQYKTQITKAELEWHSLKQKKISQVLKLASQYILIQEQIKSLDTLIAQQQALVRVVQRGQRRGGVDTYVVHQSQATLSAYRLQKLSLNEKLTALKREQQHLFNTPADGHASKSQSSIQQPTNKQINWQLNIQAFNTKIWQAWQTYDFNALQSSGPRTSSDYVFVPASLRPAYKYVLQQRRDYQLATLALKLSQHARGLVMAEHNPTLNLVANLQWNKNIQSASYALQFKLPLFSGLRKLAQQREWEQTLLQARIRKQQLERDVFYQLQQAWQAYKALQKQLKLGRLGQGQSLKAWHQALQRHRVGRATLLQIVQLQSAYQQAETRVLQLQQALRDAQVQLLTAMGQDLAALYGCN